MKVPNEYREIVNIPDIEELKAEILNYINKQDYEDATFQKNGLVIKMQQEYIEYLQEIGIRNQSILEYAMGNFDIIALEIQEMLKERNETHLNTKLEIVEKEYNQNIEQPDMVSRNVNSTEMQLDETQTQIDYEERTKQIIIDQVNDTINQIERIYYNLGANDTQVQRVEDLLLEKRYELTKYSIKFTEIFKELDEKITKFVKEINNEYVSKLMGKEKEDGKEVETVVSSEFNDIDDFIRTTAKEEVKPVVSKFSTEQEVPKKEQSFQERIAVANPNNQFEKNAVSTVKEKQEKQENQEVVKSKFIRDDDIF